MCIRLAAHYSVVTQRFYQPAVNWVGGYFGDGLDLLRIAEELPLLIFG